MGDLLYDAAIRLAVAAGAMWIVTMGVAFAIGFYIRKGRD